MKSTKTAPHHLDNSSNASPRRHALPDPPRPVFTTSFHYLEESYVDRGRSASLRVLKLSYVEMHPLEEPMDEPVPMDVDLPPARSEWRSLRLKKKGPKSRSEDALASRQRVYIYTVPLISLFVALLYGLYGGASKDVSVPELRRDLTENVFEQGSQVEALVLSVERYPVWPRKVKTLVFTGTRGVGKTYSANLARKHFSDHCVRDVSIKRLRETGTRKSIANSLSNHCLNLVIIDDLEHKHHQYIFEFIHLIPDDRRALIITIYNLYSDDDNLNLVGTLEDGVLIENDYDRSGLYYESLTFSRFDTAQVERWVSQQLQAMNVTGRSQSRIVEEVLLGHDVDRNGLKGLHSKLMIEARKHENK